ncbi:MAG: hypothetical protein ACJ8IR_09120 [Alphaproteobacteria bacterium]
MELGEHGYLLIAGLAMIGAGLVILSLFVNTRVVQSVVRDERHREKQFEYYRNTASQLGVLLIGIGVSLFIFFFQQNFKDQHDRDLELKQVLAKTAIRAGRTAPSMEMLNEYDAILDKGRPYVRLQNGGANAAVIAPGAAFAQQVRELLAAERDVDLTQFENFNFSRDLESSSVIETLDPRLFANVTRDESYLNYAVTQLKLDYKDLQESIGDEPVDKALSDPAKEAKIKDEVLDIFYDADLLRDRSRRLLGRACWFVKSGRKFVSLRPLRAVEADYKSHTAWLHEAKSFYGQLQGNGTNCFELLHYSTVPPS